MAEGTKMVEEYGVVLGQQGAQGPAIQRPRGERLQLGEVAPSWGEGVAGWAMRGPTRALEVVVLVEGEWGCVACLTG